MGAIFSMLAPILTRLFAWVLDWIQTGDETKKAFYKFVAAWEEERGVSIKLHKSGLDQLARIREELKPKPVEK